MTSAFSSSLPYQAAEPVRSLDPASVEIEFQKRLAAYRERTQRHSYARRRLIDALLAVGSAALGMAARLET
jgi:hypothetical protein